MSHPPLLLLHGALETSAQFDGLTAKLCDSFEVHRFTFAGHGDTVGKPLSIDHMVEQTKEYIHDQNLEQPNIFGYSMGGYVGLLMAKQYSQYLSRIATLGTILNWSPSKAEQENRLLNADKIKQKVPQFAEHLSNLHGEQWPELVDHTQNLLTDLGNEPPISDPDWANMTIPVRLHVGDRDQSAQLESTLEVYRKLASGELQVLPNTPHPFVKVDLDYLVTSITKFFTN
jgi:pimeloyl-ACP methyl ester carboxylesterase